MFLSFFPFTIQNTKCLFFPFCPTLCIIQTKLSNKVFHGEKISFCNFQGFEFTCVLLFGTLLGWGRYYMMMHDGWIARGFYEPNKFEFGLKFCVPPSLFLRICYDLLENIFVFVVVSVEKVFIGDTKHVTFYSPPLENFSFEIYLQAKT